MNFLNSTSERFALSAAVEILIIPSFTKVTNIRSSPSAMPSTLPSALPSALNSFFNSSTALHISTTSPFSSIGWFYGFKLHLTVNECGEILNFCLTPGNIDDRNPKVIEQLTKNMYGKLFADKGYLSQKLMEELFEKDITLITKQRKNSKNHKLLPFSDRILLRKRAIIESVNDFLKNICQIEHSRHRSSCNFITNLVSGLVAYSFLPKKPSIQFGTTISA